MIYIERELDFGSFLRFTSAVQQAIWRECDKQSRPDDGLTLDEEIEILNRVADACRISDAMRNKAVELWNEKGEATSDANG